MATMPREMTLVELCRLLNVTPSWVSKTIRELDLPRAGRGKLRTFSQDEYHVFRNIRIMLICNISWSHIKKVREWEKGLIRDFERFKKTVNLDGKTAVGSKSYVPLMLNPGIECPYGAVQAQGGKADDLWDHFMRANDEEASASSVKKEIISEIQSTIKILNEFKVTPFYGK